MKPSTSLGTRSKVGMVNPSPLVRQAGNIRGLLRIHEVCRRNILRSCSHVKDRCRCRVTIDADSKAVVEQHVARTDPAFPAVVCSLGALGIVTKVQFRVIDELYFETVQKIVPLDEVLQDVASTSKAYDFWRIDWI